MFRRKTLEDKLQKAIDQDLGATWPRQRNLRVTQIEMSGPRIVVCLEDKKELEQRLHSLLDGSPTVFLQHEAQQESLSSTVSKLHEALAFMRCCEASGECGADHPVVLEALEMFRRYGCP
jgi:hypothetical protein